MNNDHFYTGLMYFEDKKENSSPDQPPADEAAKKAELWAKIETMGKGKPHHASGIAKLVKFIKDNENGE